MPTCQYKDGCDKEAEYRVVARFDRDTYTRLLCRDHAMGAVNEEGRENITQMVRQKYGYVREARTHRLVKWKGKRSGYQPAGISNNLRVPVAHDTTLKVSDKVLAWFARSILTTNIAWNGGSCRWGFAPIVKISEPESSGGRLFRSLSVPMPEEWDSVASVEAAPLPLERHGR
jgi:hypothetical protein